MYKQSLVDTIVSVDACTCYFHPDYLFYASEGPAAPGEPICL